ncbi:cytochrome P450 4C1-like isoform X2 [Diabrotica virgifera virgifera]|uniref:Cytochrome P450 4d2-like n=1 Tax=Diabrotica virgifera virgifera TaxID=50390 RepID=A0ABM5JUE6_DIAVI|nr:cytochrome P450 4C1-like isoform X2 [Diabrotica virgifera virgifera]
MIGLGIIIVVLFIAFYFYQQSRRNTKYMRNVPGPKPNIFFGNLLEFAFIPTHKYLDVFLGFIRDYGKLVKVYDGPFSMAMIATDEKFVEHILSSTKYIDKADQYDYMKGWLGEGLLTSTGAKWKKRRRMLTPAFHFSILENFLEVFDSVGDIFIQKLRREVGKKTVEISEPVSLYTLDVICEAAMGIKLNAQTDSTSPYVRSTRSMCSIIVERILSPLDPSLYPLTLNYYREKIALKVLHAYTDSVIDKKISEKKKKTEILVDKNTNIGIKKKQAFLDLLLDYTMDGEPLLRTDIREEVDTFMFEGHDTTSSAISFAIFALANHPEVQEKAFMEQKEMFGNFSDAKPTVSQFQDMKYLDLVIKETLRLYPSVPVLGRRLPEDMEYDGHLLPKGMNILLSTFAMHRCKEYFPEPLKFIPERFEDAKLTNPYVYTPFSAGPRNCIGQKFAILEVKSTLSKILRNFELMPATPVHELQLAPQTILVSKNGIRISIKERS